MQVRDVSKGAFFGDAALKQKLSKRLAADRKAERLVQAFGYWSKEAKKGCSIGCMTRKASSANPHAALEQLFGIHEGIAHLNDVIFEGLPKADSDTFPERFIDAIRPGADLHRVAADFMAWLLADPEDGVIRFANGSNSITEAILRTANLWAARANGNEPSSAAWNAAESAAWSAAWSAARSAARSAAGSAAWSAARSAARSAAWNAAESAGWSAARSAAGSAAWSAARSAGWSAAWSAAFQRMSAKLLEMLAAAPQVQGE